MDNLLQ